MLSRSVGMPSLWEGPPSIWDTHGIPGNFFLQIQFRLFQHCIRRNCINGVHRSRSRSIRPQWKSAGKKHNFKIRDASLDCQLKVLSSLVRELFKELWSRPTTPPDFRSSFRQIPYTSDVRLLEDNIQDWGMYLFTFSYGIYALEQKVQMVDSVDDLMCSWTSTTTMETREMRLEKLQLANDEQSPMRIRPDSLVFLVKRKL